MQISSSSYPLPLIPIQCSLYHQRRQNFFVSDFRKNFVLFINIRQINTFLPNILLLLLLLLLFCIWCRFFKLEERWPGSAPSSPGCVRTPTLAPPTSWAPPPPAPPWSRFLPNHALTLICSTCLAGCHGLGFQMCHSCFDKGK